FPRQAPRVSPEIFMGLITNQLPPDVRRVVFQIGDFSYDAYERKDNPDDVSDPLRWERVSLVPHSVLENFFPSNAFPRTRGGTFLSRLEMTNPFYTEKDDTLVIRVVVFPTGDGLEFANLEAVLRQWNLMPELSHFSKLVIADAKTLEPFMSFERKSDRWVPVEINPSPEFGHTTRVKEVPVDTPKPKPALTTADDEKLEFEEIDMASPSPSLKHDELNFLGMPVQQFMQLIQGSQRNEILEAVRAQMLALAQRGQGVDLSSQPFPFVQRGLTCSVLVYLNGVLFLRGPHATAGLEHCVDQIMRDKGDDPYNIFKTRDVLRNASWPVIGYDNTAYNPVDLVQRLFSGDAFIIFNIESRWHCVAFIPLTNPTAEHFVASVSSLPGCNVQFPNLVNILNLDEFLQLVIQTRLKIAENLMVISLKPKHDVNDFQVSSDTESAPIAEKIETRVPEPEMEPEFEATNRWAHVLAHARSVMEFLDIQFGGELPFVCSIAEVPVTGTYSPSRGAANLPFETLNITLPEGFLTSDNLKSFPTARLLEIFSSPSFRAHFPHIRSVNFKIQGKEDIFADMRGDSNRDFMRFRLEGLRSKDIPYSHISAAQARSMDDMAKEQGGLPLGENDSLWQGFVLNMNDRTIELALAQMVLQSLRWENERGEIRPLSLKDIQIRYHRRTNLAQIVLRKPEGEKWRLAEDWDQSFNELFSTLFCTEVYNPIQTLEFYSSDGDLSAQDKFISRSSYERQDARGEDALTLFQTLKSKSYGLSPKHDFKLHRFEIVDDADRASLKKQIEANAVISQIEPLHNFSLSNRRLNREVMMRLDRLARHLNNDAIQHAFSVVVSGNTCEVTFGDAMAQGLTNVTDDDVTRLINHTFNPLPLFDTLEIMTLSENVFLEFKQERGRYRLVKRSSTFTESPKIAKNIEEQPRNAEEKRTPFRIRRVDSKSILTGDPIFVHARAIGEKTESKQSTMRPPPTGLAKFSRANFRGRPLVGFRAPRSFPISGLNRFGAMRVGR
ncbi:MAG TPA: hypothetical protein DDW49_02065, partial [Deltaproteobacteria bacterium]|nr:hypothetical protein [Deltaproteobacteria bacterium]